MDDILWGGDFVARSLTHSLTHSLAHSAVIYGFDQQGWYGMFVACGIWCLADVSSVSPSSEQTGEFPSLLRRRANARNVS